MKVTDYTVRSISANEVQELLGHRPMSVFLLLYSPEPGSEPSLIRPAPQSAVVDPTDAIPNDTNISEQLLAEYLHQLGIPAHIRGYEYLKKAIEFSMEDPSLLSAMTKELYPDIARCCGSTAKNVERSIRHAIEVAWNRGSLQLQQDLFGTTIDSLRGKPTNGEFIAMVAEKFRLLQTEPPT